MRRLDGQPKKYPPRTAEHTAKIAASRRARGQANTPTKVCPACGRELPRESFGNRQKTGYSNAYCNPCSLAKQRVRTKVLRKNPAWRAHMAVLNRRTVLRIKYGITPEEYDQLSALQDGLCAVCGGAENRGRKHLDVDHSHDSERVRGLLCSNCNRGIGLFGDNAETLRAAASYLERTSKLKHGEDAAV